ncbi:calcitonin gene-related peptide type 1 receptor-like [Vanessa atalanta]|uniref:calcitonin gene-related peptide type 1 receptor-like n=1 Tax=Vanessa atalanta TaxID=42275 RepID=UPI001FCCC9A5|nr:calcitonin gene-related peptide type 1 receptor-like [Vanessa atalanta]
MAATNVDYPDFEHSSPDQSIDYVKERCYEHNDTFSSVLDHSPSNDTDIGPSCSRIFDGFCCWDETPAGETAYQPCPSYITDFDPKQNVFKKCSDDGTWAMDPDTNLTLTNYTSCYDMESPVLSIVNQIYVYGYGISTVTLLISMFIFIYFRAFRFTRIRIHVHLFGAFIVNNLSWIIWFKTVVNSAEVIRANGIWCQVLHILTHYFLVASYSWMTIESMKMLLVIVKVFLDDHLMKKYLGAIGWVTPIFIVGLYASVRYYISGPTDRCWMGHSEALWILIVPIFMSLLVSLFILLNVVRVVVTKLRPTPSRRIYTAIKRGIRTAFILGPLFGIHFIVVPIRPPNETKGEKFFHILWALLTSLQGLCLSILYCFTDSEVIAAIKQYYARVMSRNDDMEMRGI